MKRFRQWLSIALLALIAAGTVTQPPARSSQAEVRQKIYDLFWWFRHPGPAPIPKDPAPDGNGGGGGGAG